MNKQNRNRLIDREHFDGFQVGGVGRMGKKGEGIKKYKLVVTE